MSDFETMLHEGGSPDDGTTDPQDGDKTNAGDIVTLDDLTPELKDVFGDGEPDADNGTDEDTPPADESSEDDTGDGSPDTSSKEAAERAKFLQKRHQEVMEDLKQYDPEYYEKLRAKLKGKSKDDDGGKAKKQSGFQFQPSDDEDFGAMLNRFGDQLQRNMLAAMEENSRRASDAAYNQAIQDKIEATFEKELATFKKVMVGFQRDCGDERYQEALNKVGRYFDADILTKPGGPTRVAHALADALFNGVQADHKSAASQRAAAEAAAKIEAAKGVAQPAAGGAPQTGGKKKTAEELALEAVESIGPNPFERAIHGL